MFYRSVLILNNQIEIVFLTKFHAMNKYIYIHVHNNYNYIYIKK